MLSTEHDHPQVSEREDEKPQAIFDYNESKGGVDTVTFDMMIDTYRSKVATRRWPTVVWPTVLDAAGVIWRETHVDPEQRRRNAIRSEYLKQLRFQLIQPQVQNRFNAPGLTPCITLAISTFPENLFHAITTDQVFRQFLQAEAVVVFVSRL